MMRVFAGSPTHVVTPGSGAECNGTKKAGAEYLLDISATRLSL